MSVSKPFGNNELLARVNAALCHASNRDHSVSNSIYADGYLQLDMGRRIVSVNGEEIKLTFTEFDVSRRAA